MRKDLLCVLTALLLSGSYGRSSEDVPTIPPPPAPVKAGKKLHKAVPAELPASSKKDACAAPPADPLFWAAAGYTLWWIKPGPLPVPLVTTTVNPANALPGALGLPDTRVLFGGSPLEFPAQHGVHFTTGAWITRARLIGLEAGGFFFQQASTGFSAASTTAEGPALFIPVFNLAAPAGEGAFILAQPAALYSGNVAVIATSRFWGLESHAIANVLSTERVSLIALAGFRYLDLQERLQLNGVSEDLLIDEARIFQDQFSAQNQFFGGQLGARAEYRSTQLLAALPNIEVFANLTGKVALGATREQLNVSGATLVSGTGAFFPGLYPGGVFAQPTNAGRQDNTEFGVVPQVGVNIGLTLLEFLRLQVGYEFLYWSSVLRPGDQLDRGINPTQTLGQPLIGPVRPAPLFNRTDFWAHGLNLGLLVQF